MNLIWYDTMGSRTVDQHIDNGTITRTRHRVEAPRIRKVNRCLIVKSDRPYLRKIDKYHDGRGVFDGSLQRDKLLANSKT